MRTADTLPGESNDVIPSEARDLALTRHVSQATAPTLYARSFALPGSGYDL